MSQISSQLWHQFLWYILFFKLSNLACKATSSSNSNLSSGGSTCFLFNIMDKLSKQENVLRQAEKNGLPLSMFPFLGSLPQTTNLVVCICGGGGDYQMQIVTKLPNENIQNYKRSILGGGGGR